MKIFSKCQLISLILMLTCIQVTIVAVIPHHHHHHEICLADDFDEDHDATPECEEHDCITHFKAVSQHHHFLQDLSELQSIDVPNLQLFTVWDITNGLLPLLEEEPGHAVCFSTVPLGPLPYLERLEGRAPPMV